MNSLTSIGIAVLVLVYLLARQVQTRPVKQGSRAVFLVLLAVGAYQIVRYVDDHPVTGVTIAILVASLVVAGGFGAARAYTVRLWRDGGVLYQKGTPVTVVLWIVGIGVHFGVDVLIDHGGSAHGLATAALMLYVAVSFGIQRLVVTTRAARSADQVPSVAG